MTSGPCSSIWVAYVLVLAVFFISCPCIAETPAAETAALDALYTSTNGADAWVNKWDLGTPPCERFGITCDPADHITDISLPNNGLTGPIPDSIGDLPNLLTLELQNNWLQGPIPATFGTLVNLETLDLSHNALVGGLNTYNNDGPWIARTTKLKIFKLGYNNMEGILPVNIGYLPNLIVLELANNRFFSILPWTLVHCVSLEILDVSNNRFVEPLLDFVQNSTAPIREIHLSNNKVYDNIPEWFAPKLAPTLEILELDGNNLYGAIPENFGLLTKLTVLQLEDNFLQGDLPASLATIEGLGVLRVSNNCLSGVINPDFCDVDRDEFDVGVNPWVCPIPPCLLEEPGVACAENATQTGRCTAFYAESSSSSNWAASSARSGSSAAPSALTSSDSVSDSTSALSSSPTSSASTSRASILANILFVSFLLSFALL